MKWSKTISCYCPFKRNYMDLACVLLVRKSKAARASRRERAGGRRGEEAEGGGSGTFASAAATLNRIE
jgi:hypothetical protein